MRRSSAPRQHHRSVVQIAALLLAACGGPDQDGARASLELPPTPPDHAEGERLFNANCASCHGLHAAGTATGPPLVHVVYEPSHHADAAFFLAITRGVRAHHWRFGNMPPQPQVDRAAAEKIVDYVRWLQRQAGIR